MGSHFLHSKRMHQLKEQTGSLILYQPSLAGAETYLILSAAGLPAGSFNRISSCDRVGDKKRGITWPLSVNLIIDLESSSDELESGQNLNYWIAKTGDCPTKSVNVNYKASCWKINGGYSRMEPSLALSR